MSNGGGTGFYLVLLDQVGKLVVSSGVILALAYVAGYVYSWHLYSALHSTWVLKFIDPQGHIKEGLPWIMYCTAVAGLAFFSFSNSEKMAGFGNGTLFLFASVVIAATSISQAFGVNLESFQIFNSFLALLLSLYAASALALSIKMLAERKSGLQVLLVATLGLAGTTVVFPFLQADELARDLKLGGADRPLVVDEKNITQGILVSAIGSKYLILDCKVPYQLSLVEPTPSLRIRPSVEACM